MSRRFTVVTAGLASVVAFLIGLVVAGAVPPPTVSSASGAVAGARRDQVGGGRRAGGFAPVGLVNFADVAARVNPAVVSVDAASRGRGPQAGKLLPPPDGEADPHRWGQHGDDEEDPNAPFEGAASGFIIDRDGYILTNHHVIERAERIIVKLADGRSLRATVAGSDPPTDIALLKINPEEPLPVAPIGDSSALRPGDWVCAIGNPLAYEHSVTVGVVSFLGRKLFDASLDDYIQTDAAINLGNSGGPLLNVRGEVIGINAAMSWYDNSIGFAIPINQAMAVVPQLKRTGRVSRGYIGITLRDLDPDLSRTLSLGTTSGALVQDVTAGAPGEGAGLRPYDVVVAIDGEEVRTNDDLIQRIAAAPPGAVKRLSVLRDRVQQTVEVRLTERPVDDEEDAAEAAGAPRPALSGRDATAALLGLQVRALDAGAVKRYRLRSGLEGVVVTSVEPMGPAEAAGFEAGDVLIEINRAPVPSLEAYARVAGATRAGDVLGVFAYSASLGHRVFRTVHAEPWQP
jgi:Do/DeqQ family serine protease